VYARVVLLACAVAVAIGAVIAGASVAAQAANPAISRWALTYTHGSSEGADLSLAPVVVGFINQENSVPSFPEASAGINAAVKYVNTELGGADGHRVVVKKCVVKSEEDGQRCGIQMQNDRNVKFVILGVTAVGQKSIYSVLKKPIVSVSPSTIDDLAAKNAYSYTSGGPGVIAGMGVFTAKYLKAKNVAVVSGNNPAAQQSAQQFLKPLLEQLGVKSVRLVAVPDDATGPNVVSAIQAVGAEKADVLVAFTVLNLCIALYDGLKSLAINPTVVATGLCFGTPMTGHLRDTGSRDPVPDGWYFAAYGYSYFAPTLQGGMSTYVAKIRQYAGRDVEYTGFAGFAFADLLTSVRFINEIGADRLTSARFAAKARTFRGPMMLSAGAMKCGYSKTFPALCGQKTGIEQYKGGKWLPTAMGGRSINVAPILGG
jgi:branched-chain amino acid transport system substrate-binding protein